MIDLFRVGLSGGPDASGRFRNLALAILFEAGEASAPMFGLIWAVALSPNHSGIEIQISHTVPTPLGYDGSPARLGLTRSGRVRHVLRLTDMGWMDVGERI